MLMDTPASLADLKKAARRQAASTRAQIHAVAAATAREALARAGGKVLGAGHGRIVAGFHAYRSEIDVVPLIAALAAAGWATALPVIIATDAPLVFRRWAPGDETIPGHFGIHVPHDRAALVEPDVVLVPMLAFDRQGYRLGYGGGFYDRTLQRLRALKPVIAVGVAFAGQEVEAVPRGPFDQPLDWILTEAGPVYPIHQQDVSGV
ncbi:5-formyltetrahydrofolate cyclo-ligase [Rhodoligotrophos defluvii]|uniref:5-formyltetrahydrofolate cyclo-ligase n=1 Tax=Rhodoligotrophos defluvii TaxID=2561934 RepID=UPI001EEFFC3C|nr:5-formyltetrahydrofolate cyclo-ligase [Rhodoligotrophos defluvii]